MSQMISILLPTHNEELFIEKSLNSLLKNDYDKNMFEILVIDGMSTDKTLEITNRKHINDSRIKIISNDKIIFPAAINLGIKHAKGDIIVIVGAHAKYPKNYLTECVNGLNKYKADNVGGILETRSLKTTTLSKLIIASLSSSFGVGNSTFRVGSAEAIEVDTVFGGCYRKEVFDKYGNFNENLISSSDMEFNKRITKAGAKIILLPWIKVIYYTRTKFINFIKNNIRNGFWAITPFKYTNHMPISIRHLIPLLFFLFLILSSISFVFIPWSLWFSIPILLLYFILANYFAIKKFKELRYLSFFLPLFFFLLHFTYGLGSLFGLFNIFIPIKKGEIK